MASFEGSVLERMREGVERDPDKAAKALLSMAYEGSGTKSLAATVEGLQSAVESLKSIVNTLAEGLGRTTDKADKNENQMASVMQKLDMLMIKVDDLEDERKKDQEEQIRELKATVTESSKPSRVKTTAISTAIGVVVSAVVVQVLYVIFGFGK